MSHNISTRIVCVSDTIGKESEISIPSGSVFVHAGDFSCNGTHEQLLDFRNFVDELPHPQKMIIAGNQDISIQTDFYKKSGAIIHEELFQNPEFDALAYSTACRMTITSSSFPFYMYLDDCASKIVTDDENQTVYGAPWQTLGKIDKGVLKAKWDKIPNNIDVLITHMPPYGILDEVTAPPKSILGRSRKITRKISKGLSSKNSGAKGEAEGHHHHKKKHQVQHCGCEELLAAVERVKPRLHIFGHAVGGYGKS